MSTEGNELPDVIGMSDDDFLKQDFSGVSADVEEASNIESEEAEIETDQEEQSDPDAELVNEDDNESSDEDEGQEEVEDSSTEEDTEEDDEKDSVDDTEEKAEEESEDNYKAQLDELFAPLKANGKDQTISSVEEARKFIQMGMGYNKRMEALKPARILQKKMEKYGLLEEGKLDFLIALDKKKPEAIAKLLKDSNIDPLKLDLDTADSSYQPEAYSGNDSAIELDDVIAEIRSSASFDDTVDLITTKWDESSRRTLGEHPQIISIINGHMENGVYDKISERIEQEQMLGKYLGISNLEAYRQVGELMNREGAFTPASNPAPVTNAPIIKAPIKKETKVDPNLKRKKATASTKSSPPSKKPEPDYLNMTDEEFLASR